MRVAVPRPTYGKESNKNEEEELDDDSITSPTVEGMNSGKVARKKRTESAENVFHPRLG